MEVVFYVTKNWAFKNVFQGEETQSQPTQFLLLDMYEEKQHFILESQMCESLSTFETNLPWCAKQVQAIWLGFNVDRDIFEKEKWYILKHIHALVDLSLGACKWVNSSIITSRVFLENICFYCHRLSH